MKLDVQETELSSINPRTASKAGPLQRKESGTCSRLSAGVAWLRGLFACWEISLILLIAGILRFSLLKTTEFDGDQATIFQMAHDAVSHGLLVATSNIASVGIVNPPAIIYFLMLPALVSANPLSAALFTALLGTLSVLLTYILVRRYYGRLAASIASLLYATAALPVFYSRFIWQQNLLLFFVPLYIIFLFRGAVARRSGWLAPALFLLGLLIQLHESTLLLAIPLIMAIAMVPSTIRRRDIIFGGLLLLFIYSPYILWEISAHFSDLTILFQTTGHPSHIDSQALLFYQFFLSPYNVLSFSNQSTLFPFILLFNIFWWVMTAFVLIAAAFAIKQGLKVRIAAKKFNFYRRKNSVRKNAHMIDRTTDAMKSGPYKVINQIKCWWRNFCCSPYRCGLGILIVWQIIPLIILLRHSITLYPHYFIMFMPGPFILVGWFFAEAIDWSRRHAKILRHRALVGLIILIVMVQTTGSAISVLDLATGHFLDSASTLAGYYYNDLQSLQDALALADQFAQERHINHIYVDASRSTIDAFLYLSVQMHTPTTVFADPCVLLPNLAHGPAILLIGPHSDLTETLLPHYLSLSLIATANHLAAPPFHIYLISSLKQPELAGQDIFGSDLQLLQYKDMTFQKHNFLLTHWRFLQYHPAADDFRYSYDMIPKSPIVKNMLKSRQGIHHPASKNHLAIDTANCLFTSIQAGDQLIASFQLPRSHPAPWQLEVKAAILKRNEIVFGLPFETFIPPHADRRTLGSISIDHL